MSVLPETRNLVTHKPVPLACLIHAASVHPGPGSNPLLEAVSDKVALQLLISRTFCSNDYEIPRTKAEPIHDYQPSASTKSLPQKVRDVLTQHIFLDYWQNNVYTL